MAKLPENHKTLGHPGQKAATCIGLVAYCHVPAVRAFYAPGGHECRVFIPEDPSIHPARSI